MPNKRYKIGYGYEYRLVKKFIRAGWEAYRTAGSKGIRDVDVIAIKPDPITNNVVVKLIQVKATSNEKYDWKNLTRKERAILLELAHRYKNYDNVSVELWIFYRGKRKHKIIDIKKLL